MGLPIVARVVSHSAHAHEPGLFTTAPVPRHPARRSKKAGWSVEDVDLWEINEAFAVVAMIAMQELGIDHAKLNVNGGATALGHPIGASGARVLATLLGALQARGGTKGVASPCASAAARPWRWQSNWPEVPRTAGWTRSLPFGPPP
jgi:acetyl-CoA C-acetyltransferase